MPHIRTEKKFENIVQNIDNPVFFNTTAFRSNLWEHSDFSYQYPRHGLCEED